MVMYYEINSLDAIRKVRPENPKLLGEDQVGGRFLKVGARTFEGTDHPFEYVDMNQGTVIMPYIGDGSELYTMLAGQFRPGPQAYILEYPGGNRDAGESGLIAVVRELGEEAGWDPRKVVALGGEVYRDAYVEGTIESFLGLGPRGARRSQQLGEHETIDLYVVPVRVIAPIMTRRDPEFPVSLPTQVTWLKAIQQLEATGTLPDSVRDAIHAEARRNRVFSISDL